MAQDSQAILRDFKPRHDFFVGVDSDGCVFDTMGIKQRECFCPWMIKYFGLQPVAEAARECKEFADLFSRTRGSNRHTTLKRIFCELLPGHPAVRRRKFHVPHFPHYFAWVDDPGSVLSNQGLAAAADATPSEEARKELLLFLEWSEKVNWAIKEIVAAIPPFPFVRECLERISEAADVIVVSATPEEALLREWEEHGLAKYAAVIAGQERGTKAEHLKLGAKGKYPDDRILLIGDALGDLRAARTAGALFYPVNPGREEASWETLYSEALDRFLDGSYAGRYETALIEEFEELLPEHPPWAE